ncbi:hypothetical protein D3C81_26200 [compost metagenome]
MRAEIDRLKAPFFPSASITKYHSPDVSDESAKVRSSLIADKTGTCYGRNDSFWHHILVYLHIDVSHIESYEKLTMNNDNTLYDSSPCLYY